MRNTLFALLFAVSLASAPFTGGCDREVSHQEKTTTGPNGTSHTEQTTTEHPNGTQTTEKKTTQNP